MLKDFAKRYLLRGFIAACIYCIVVVVFLYRKHFEDIWLLFLGNGLYLLAVSVVVFLSNKAHKFSQSPVTSAISGHVLSLTGAAISVALSLLLYLLFYLGIDGSKGEALHGSPAEMSHNAPNNGIIFVLIVVAALGNTITGFFAAVITSFTSFTSSRKELGQNKS
jgi:hypothetical protein